MRKVRIAVIGVGVHGSRHADKLARSERAELVAVVDTDQLAAAAVAARHGVPAFHDHREILTEVDAVCIVVPTQLHFEIACDCLLAGVDVLVEKPIAMNLAQADHLIAFAARSRRVLQVGHVERFNPAIRALAPRLQTPSYLSFNRVAMWNGRGVDVGVGLDLMIHDLDLACWMVGRPVIDVEAVGSVVRSTSFDLLQARLHFEGGCIADLFASRVGPRPERRLSLMQPRGYALADLLERRLTHVDGDAVEVAMQPLVADALEAEIAEFLERVLDRQPPRVDGPAGRQALACALAIDDVARKGGSRMTMAELPPRALGGT